MTTIGPRSERWQRSTRRIYTTAGFPLFYRSLVGVYPVLALACAVVVLAALLPRSVGQWLGLAWLDLLGIAVLLTYRTPPPFTPQFLRDEIARGQIPLQRPDSFDRIVLVFIVAALIFLNIALPMLILGYLGT